MRRMLLILTLVAATLSACGSGDTTVPPPPNATAIDSVESLPGDKLGPLVSEWKTAAPASMKADAVKPETIEEKIYTSTSSLADVQSHYNELTSKGWYTVKKLTNLKNDQVLLLGYEHGTTALLVAAVDMAPLGGSGVLIYTLKGTK